MLDPRKIVEEWDIRPGMKVADFGCGAGHYSIEVAKRIGQEGVVYAFDIQPEMLSAIKSRATLEHLINIETRRVDLESGKGTQLTDGILDFIIVSNVLFQAEEKKAIVQEAFRVLKPEIGRVAVVEWDSASGPVAGHEARLETSLGPPKDRRIDKAEALDLFKDTGFVLEKEFDAGKFHYGLIFKKA